MSKPQEMIEKASAAVNQGDIDAARGFIHKIKNYKNNPNALNILALCHAMKNEHSLAEKLFSKTIKLAGPSDIVLGNLGLTQLHQQNITAAINSFQKALSLNPNHYDSIRNIAIAYEYNSDQTNAVKNATIAHGINQNDPVMINIIARQMMYNNRTQESIKLYTQSLQLHPQQPNIYQQLAGAHCIIKDYDNAENILKRAGRLFSDNVALNIALGGFYETRNRYDDALEVYENALQKDAGNTVAIAAKGRALIALRQHDTAENLLLSANDKFPANPDICAELCGYYILKNNYAESYKRSKDFLSSIKPGEPIPANIALSHSTACRHSKRLDEAQETLKQAIETKLAPVEIQETLLFSMGDVLDRMKHYDEAFGYYKMANEIIPRPSDILYYESVLTEISEKVNRKMLDAIGSTENRTSLPVFIVGMPRSGTSLVEQIVSSHPDVYGAGELNNIYLISNEICGAMNLLEYTQKISSVTLDSLKEFSAAYLNKLTELSNGERRVTDKLPHNFIQIGLIELLFPDTKIIHCQRHPFDTCLSIYFRKFNDNNVYAKDLGELARFYKKYTAMMAHWNENSSLSILTVRYEDMVTAQETESRRLIEHLELDWTDEVLDYHKSDRIIMTPSYHQASKPIYTDSMYRWKNYKKNIEQLIDILGNPEQYN